MVFTGIIYAKQGRSHRWTHGGPGSPIFGGFLRFSGRKPRAWTLAPFCHRTPNSGHRTAAIESAGGRTMRRANRGGRYVSRTTGRAARGLIHYLERMQGKKTRHTVPGSMVDCGGAYNVRNTPSGSRNFISVQPAFGVPKSSSGSNPS